MEPLPGQRPLAVGLGGLLVAEIVYVSWQGVDLVGGAGANSAALEGINQDPGNVVAIARVLFSRYLLPFEITSILLVVAIVGVMVLAKRMTALAGAPQEPVKVEGEA